MTGQCAHKRINIYGLRMIDFIQFIISLYTTGETENLLKYIKIKYNTVDLKSNCT